MARAIRPVHTVYDGDTMFCMASGVKPVANLTVLECATVRATQLAIQNAVRGCVEYTVVSDLEDDDWQCE